MANVKDFDLEAMAGTTQDGQAVTDFEEAFHEPHLPRYMVLVKGNDDGNTFYESMFFEDYFKAQQYMMDGNCGMGYYCELYERVLKDGCCLCYDFLEA